MNTPEKENLNSPENEALKDKALNYLKLYMGDSHTLREHRENALKAYRRDAYPEDAAIPEGSRSKFIMSDVADTIEWIMPSLMRIFHSGPAVVKIEGHGPEDEPGAKLLNEKVNWDFMRQNNGFMILYDAFKAAMLDKFTAVKYWWDNHDEYEPLEFKDLTDQAYQTLEMDPDFIIEKHDETVIQEEQPPQIDPMSGMMLMEGAPRMAQHSVKGKRIKERVRRPVAEVLPGEEFIGSITAKDFKAEEFVAHRKRMHRADVMEKYGLTEEDLTDEGQQFTSNDTEFHERFKDLGGIGFFQDQENRDFIYIYECFLKNDKREPVKLTILGNRTIDKENNSYGRPPFCTGSPIRMPHRAIGLSLAELVMDLQKLRSSLARFILNNIYYQTDGMLIVNPDKINVSDFLTNRRPGGIVRTKNGADPTDAVFPVPVLPLAGHSYGLLESIDGWKENRTGVTRYNQGADADSLNKTAQGISQIMAASQQRIELIARIFAETLVKDLLTAFAQMNVDYLDIPTNIRLNDGWQAVDPKSIDVKFDVAVDVALGTGSRDQRAQQLMAMQDRSLNVVLLQSGIIQPQNAYELMKAIWVELGYKNPEKFLTDPSTLIPVVPNGPVGPEGQIVGTPAGAAGGAGPVGPGQIAA